MGELLNFAGTRAGCFESFPEKKYISNFGMTSRLIALVVNLMYGFWCKKYSPEAGVRVFFRATMGERLCQWSQQFKWNYDRLWWITDVILDTGILRFDLDWTISNLTSSVNINILNIIVARFDFQKASETERLCKKHPSLLDYITVSIYSCIHKTWMNMDSKRERERESYTVY